MDNITDALHALPQHDIFLMQVVSQDVSNTS